MSTSVSPPGAFGELDRDAARRLSDDALDAAWREPETLLLRVREGQLVPIFKGEDPQTGLALTPVSGERTTEHYFLGRARGAAVFATAEAHSDGDSGTDVNGDVTWQHPFTAATVLSPLDIELLLVALAVVGWNQSMPFSPRDGEPTTPIQGGWARVDVHGAEHFPRTDPAVIVLIEHEDRLLLGSNVLWEAGRFSLLAGFVEAGESAEQTVVREVQEEAGILVEEVRYVASQPWPFPRSLMLGFRAKLSPESDPELLSRDTAEISELRWFTRNELRDPAPGLRLPMKFSIARWLIDLWIDEGDSER